MKNRIYFFLLLFVLFYTNLVGRMHGIYIHYIVSGILNFILTYLLLRINPFAKTGLFLIGIPILLQMIPSIDNLSKNFPFPGFIGNLMYLISTFFGILLFQKFRKIIIYSYAIIYVILVYNFSNINNYYYNTYQSQSYKNVNFRNILLTDSQGKSLILDKNKIYLIDIWALSCGICIQDLPKFKKVENYYKNNKNVKVITVNILHSQKELLKSQQIIQNFKFTNYNTNSDIKKHLNFNTVPQYMIVRKNGEIKYLGQLSIDNNEFYNNFYKLVNDELENF